MNGTGLRPQEAEERKSFMYVKLLRHTPDPEKSVAMAARLCYSAAGVDDLEKKVTPEESAKLVRMLVRMGHLSTVEHVTFTFAIEGVSRVLTHQLVRHRIASYSQQSQRYVKAHHFQTVVPPTIAAVPEAKAKYEACMQNLQDLYNDLADQYGVPAEDARYVLPNAAETKIICTFNVRSLLNFFSLRCCTRAQWEIRELAWRMLAECRKEAPVLFEKAGPNCVARGICTEGKMSCGLLPTVKEYQAAGKDVVPLFLKDGAADQGAGTEK